MNTVNTFTNCLYMMPISGQMELAQAYIVYQRYTTSYTPQVALEKGTMFPELYRPYKSKKH